MLTRRFWSVVLCPRSPCPRRHPCPTRHLQGQAQSHRLREIVKSRLREPRREGCSLSLRLSGDLVRTATKGPVSPCWDGSFPVPMPPSKRETSDPVPVCVSPSTPARSRLGGLPA